MRWAILAVIASGALCGQSRAPRTPPEGYVGRANPAPGLAPHLTVTDLGPAEHTFEVDMRKGDEVNSGLCEFFEKNHLTSAHLTALGALNSAVSGWYDPDKRFYKKIVINQEVEITSFVGSIHMQNGKPYLHAHVVVAFPDGSTKGGHLIEGHVSLEFESFVVGH